MNGRHRIQPAQYEGAGILAGVIAGVVMALVAMFRAMNQGLSFWLPMQQVSAWIFGVDALLGGWVPTLAGVVIHLGVSAIFGYLFGLFAWRISFGSAFWAGVFYGIGVWALMTFVVLPALDPVMLARVELAPRWWFGYHLIYGAVLSLASPLALAFASGDELPAPEVHEAHPA